MKVLICSTIDNKRGAGRATYRLHTALKDENVDSSMLVVRRYSEDNSVFEVSQFYQYRNVISKLLHKIIHTFKSHWRSHKLGRYNYLKDVTISDITFSQLRDSLERIDFDILHLNWIEDDFINFKELKSIKQPIVWTLHGAFPFTGICHHLLCDKYLSKCGACPLLRSSKEVDYSTEVFLKKEKRYQHLNFNIVTPSRYLGNRAGKSRLLGKYPITVIPNGLDLGLFMPEDRSFSRDHFGLNTETSFVLAGAVNMTDPFKGFNLFADAINSSSWMNTDFAELGILTFGAEGDGFNTHWDTKSLGTIEDDDILKLAYCAANLTVVPSKYENLPNIIMESMACGTPVIAFDIGGNSDMIDHQVNGYLAKPFDTEDLAQGIKWCLSNNENNRLGMAARKKVQEYFDIKEISRRYIELYESLQTAS